MGFRYPPEFWERACDQCDDWQIEAVNQLTHERGGIVWAKVGEGKSRVGIYLFASLQEVYNWSIPSICLVVCRRRSFYDWSKEIRECIPNVQVYEDETPIFPPSREPVFLLVSHAELVKRKDSLRQNNNIKFVIFDESWLYANNKSGRFKAAHRISLGRQKTILSGTIMKARDLDEVYCQATIAGVQRRIAGSLTKFRSEYQVGLTIGATESSAGFGKNFAKRGAYDKLMRKLKDVAIVHFPKTTKRIHNQFHDIPATKKQLEYFEELREYCELQDLGLEFKHVMHTCLKAQQIANGWIADSTGAIRSVPSNKSEKLKDELSDIIAGGGRAVVWCAFRYDVEMLSDFLPFASLQMLGGQDFDIDRWNRGDIRVCLATEASGSSVNYFANTQYAIYFSADYKWLHMQQSRGRTERKSTRHTDCYYKYLQVADSMDSHVYKMALASGASEEKLIQSAVSNWLKRKL